MPAGDPSQGGATSAVLQYALALQALDHDVLIIGPQPSDSVTTEVKSYFDAVCPRFHLRGRAVLLPQNAAPYGLAESDLADFVHRSSVLINLSGRWHDPQRYGEIPLRIYLDMDPGFTHIWHEQGPDVGLAGHTHHASVGAALADPAELGVLTFSDVDDAARAIADVDRYYDRHALAARRIAQEHLDGRLVAGELTAWVRS